MSVTIASDMRPRVKRILTSLAPALGAGGIGACPLCWAGSASALTYIGLGGLIPYWRWLSFGLIGLGALGFIRDGKIHKKPWPLILLVSGAILLYLGRYAYGGKDFGGWQIWGPGAFAVVAAVIWNRMLFRQRKIHS